MSSLTKDQQDRILLLMSGYKEGEFTKDEVFKNIVDIVNYPSNKVIDALLLEVHFLRLQVAFAFKDMTEDEFDKKTVPYLFSVKKYDMKELVSKVKHLYTLIKNKERLDSLLISRIFECDMDQANEAYGIIEKHF